MNRRTWLLALLFCLAAVTVAAGADASMTGPCTATIGGTDFATASQADVDSGDNLAYAFSAPTPLASYALELHYGPYSAAPSSGTVESDQTSIAGEVPLEKYTWLGTGLYELTGNVALVDGRTCEGSINVAVHGNPLASAVGATAAVITAGSTIGLIALFLKGSAAAVV